MWHITLQFLFKLRDTGKRFSYNWWNFLENKDSNFTAGFCRLVQVCFVILLITRETLTQALSLSVLRDFSLFHVLRKHYYFQRAPVEILTDGCSVSFWKKQSSLFSWGEKQMAKIDFYYFMLWGHFSPFTTSITTKQVCLLTKTSWFRL